LESLNYEDQDDGNGNTEEIVEEEDDVTHCLPFKCIGAAHERFRQEHLERAQAALELGQNVEVMLRPEPTNAIDTNAIAIDMDHGSGFVNVGYIASELTKYIHPLLHTDKILHVSVQHIIFRVYFMKIGFYPKILIKRQGTWDPYVLRKSRSVR
jgi:hypothetical protein